MLVFKLQRDVAAVGVAGFLDEVLLQQVGNISILFRLSIELVAVDVGQLHEVFPIAFHIHSDVVGDIEFGA